MIFSRWGSGAALIVACAAVIGWGAQGAAAASSSCVTCHLDEDMLTDSLAVVKAKKSAMQSGAG